MFVFFFNYGLFDCFFKVKVVILEFQVGWIGYILDWMDVVWCGPFGKIIGMKEFLYIYFEC